MRHSCFSKWLFPVGILNSFSDGQLFDMFPTASRFLFSEVAKPRLFPQFCWPILKYWSFYCTFPEDSIGLDTMLALFTHSVCVKMGLNARCVCANLGWYSFSVLKCTVYIVSVKSGLWNTPSQLRGKGGTAISKIVNLLPLQSFSSFSWCFSSSRLKLWQLYMESVYTFG